MKLASRGEQTAQCVPVKRCSGAAPTVGSRRKTKDLDVRYSLTNLANRFDETGPSFTGRNISHIQDGRMVFLCPVLGNDHLLTGKFPIYLVSHKRGSRSEIRQSDSPLQVVQSEIGVHAA